ncbi:MAG TPA: hypothetical protein ENK47_08715 [Euryarchaeota archaeon]|nr:hypothetical protein [Euryarchaeota archaeon]
MGHSNRSFPSNDRELLEAIDGWIEDVNMLDEGTVILVEGMKDTTALRTLGVVHPIVEVNKGRNMFDLVSDLRSEGCVNLVILTDWDRTGGIIASRIRKACSRLGVDYDLDRRRELSFLVGKWISCVESLPVFISHLDR